MSKDYNNLVGFLGYPSWNLDLFSYYNKNINKADVEFCEQFHQLYWIILYQVKYVFVGLFIKLNIKYNFFLWKMPTEITIPLPPPTTFICFPLFEAVFVAVWPWALDSLASASWVLMLKLSL